MPCAPCPPQKRGVCHPALVHRGALARMQREMDALAAGVALP